MKLKFYKVKVNDKLVKIGTNYLELREYALFKSNELSLNSDVYKDKVELICPLPEDMKQLISLSAMPYSVMKEILE